MSKYTTGEIAKLCGVSVRTVQYYDSRNILVPSELSEGGRRLYSEDDLKRMRIICFLREVGLPINSISELLAEEHPENIISILLDQQVLQEELHEAQKKIDMIGSIQQNGNDVFRVFFRKQFTDAVNGKSRFPQEADDPHPPQIILGVQPAATL